MHLDLDKGIQSITKQLIEKYGPEKIFLFGLSRLSLGKGVFSMAERRLVDEWLKKAEEDYQFAGSVLEDSAFYAQICFHVHQAADKYLKAFIVARNLEFQKIHDYKPKTNLLEGRDGSTIFQYH